MARENVKIPAKHYVGLAKRHGDGIPLGFMTPWGEDAAAVKRMQTVDSWAGRDKLSAVTIDNVPMSGFKLTKSIRTTNYGGHDHWRVEDPRGFELEISSGNLAQLLSVGTVEQGEFLDQCVWARHGANNVLLSTATEEYKEAIENTRVAALKSSWKDVKLGNRVVLQNNTRGIWLGKMHHVSMGYNNQHDNALGENELDTSTRSVHLILTDESLSNRWTKTLYMIATPKLSFVEDASTVLTEAEAELQANALLQDPEVYISKSGYRDPIAVSFSPIHCGDNLTLSILPIGDHTQDEFEEMLSGYERPKVFGRCLEVPFGALYKYSKDKETKITAVSEQHIEAGEYRKLLVKNNDRSSWYGMRGANFSEHTVRIPITSFREFYHIKATIKTKAGNSIEAFLR